MPVTPYKHFTNMFLGDFGTTFFLDFYYGNTSSGDQVDLSYSSGQNTVLVFGHHLTVANDGWDIPAFSTITGWDFNIRAKANQSPYGNIKFSAQLGIHPGDEDPTISVSPYPTVNYGTVTNGFTQNISNYHNILFSATNQTPAVLSSPYNTAEYVNNRNLYVKFQIGGIDNNGTVSFENQAAFFDPEGIGSFALRLHYVEPTHNKVIVSNSKKLIIGKEETTKVKLSPVINYN